MTATRMVRDVKRILKDWEYDIISIGYPGPVIHGRPVHDPHNLGGGWVGFDFGKALGAARALQSTPSTTYGLVTRPAGMTRTGRRASRTTFSVTEPKTPRSGSTTHGVRPRVRGFCVKAMA